jgi:diphthamide synthase (EF-2-diphthine--ammonia ligase)
VSVVLSWSGGKDSALALWTMREEGTGPAALLTTIVEDGDRVGTHAVRAGLVRAQAAAAGLPLIEAPIPETPSNEVYEARIAAALDGWSPAIQDGDPDAPPTASADARPPAGSGACPHARPPAGQAPVPDAPPPAAPTAVADSASSADPVAAPASAPSAGIVAFADLFLADIRVYREERLTAAGRQAIFPLWGRDTGALAREFIAAGFGATLVVVDTEQLDASFVGRRFTAELLAELPEGVDPCGENGEFHTFVDSGPIFAEPIPVTLGEIREEGRFVYRDLLPA